MGKKTLDSDFFTRMPCIVRMNECYPDKLDIADDDKIVRVEHHKTAYPYYTVYYFHRIYNDDRIYKCSARFKVLPEIVKQWISKRVPFENGFRIKWEGDEENPQLTFDMGC